MNDELRAHLDSLIERNLAAGMPQEEARLAALREFGGVEQIKERARDERRSVWGEQVLQDIRYAGRQLRKAPGFTATIVITLTLGIGANTAIFSLLDEVWLKPLPVENPTKLVIFEWRAGAFFNGLGGGPGTRDLMTQERIGRGFSRSAFERLRADDDRPPVDMLAFATMMLDVEIDGQRETGQLATSVSGRYFEILGINALLGRVLTPVDDGGSSAPVAVVSHHYWMSRLGADPAVIGKTIHLNNVSATIIGVLPESFGGTMGRGTRGDIFLPLSLRRSFGRENTSAWDLSVMGRLRPGATMESVKSQLAGVFRAAALEGIENHPQKMHWERSPGFPQLQLSPGARGFLRNDPKSLLTLQALAGLLLLIACFNVANLLLARGTARRREIAVRMALGASRARLIRQLLAESGLLALLGAVSGVLLAWWGKDLLLAMHPLGGGGIFAPQLDGRVLGFAIAAAAATSVLFGLGPALRATQLDLNAEFQGSVRTLGGGGFRIGRGLMVMQVALSLVLLVGAGLFARTLRNLETADVGFNREQLLVFRIEPRRAGYQRAQFSDLYQRIAARVETLPGVQAVTFSESPVLAGANGFLGNVAVPGYQTPSGENPDQAAVMQVMVGPNFFVTYQIPIVQGRLFTPRDDRLAQKVAIVDQTMARKFFGSENPIGRHFTFSEESNATPIEIIGIVRDTKSINLRHQTPPTFYVPMSQSNVPQSRASFAVRTITNPTRVAASLREAVREIDRNFPLLDLRTEDEEVEKMVGQEKFFARISSCFGVLALGLVGIGLFGLISYVVVQRTGEIGLRIALGALPRSVIWMILHQSLRMVGIGIVAGVGLALAASRLIASLLYGLSPDDPTTYAGMGLLLISVAAGACLLPAFRAAKVDPMVALRTE